MTKKKAALIGCGKMGGALLDQWVRSDTYAFSVVDPMTEKVAAGADLYPSLGALDDDVMFDLIIVAVKPQMIEDVMPDYSERLADGGTIASIAAGFSAERLSRLLGNAPVVRIMPNLPSAVGRGVSGLFATETVSSDQRDEIGTLMELAGTAVWVESEDALDRVTAVAGSGPGYVFEIARAYVAAAEALGFSNEQARDLVLGTMEGTIAMARSADDDLETLRNNVTSKNGTTQAGLDQLRRDGLLEGLFEETVKAAYERAVELR